MKKLYFIFVLFISVNAHADQMCIWSFNRASCLNYPLDISFCSTQEAQQGGIELSTLCNDALYYSNFSSQCQSQFNAVSTQLNLCSDALNNASAQSNSCIQGYNQLVTQANSIINAQTNLIKKLRKACGKPCKKIK